MDNLVYYNGEFTTYDKAKTLVEDRGNTFGDGVYDALCCLNKKPLNLEMHIDRFFNSMRKLDINCKYSKKEITEIIYKALDLCELKDSLVYFQITRGSARRSHVYNDDMQGNFYLSVRPKRSYKEYRIANGAPIISTVDERWTRCDIKSLNLLANCMAAKKASDAGCIEALLIRNGVAAECTASSIFYIKDKVIYTEPLSNLILDGINRRCAIMFAKQLGYEVCEKQSTIEEFYNADEVFITSATKLIVSVCSIDGKQIGDGNYEITDILYDEYIEYVQKQCGKIDKLEI